MPGLPAVGPGLPRRGLRSLRAPWAGQLAPSVRTAGQGGGPSAEGAADGDLPPLSQMGTFEGENCALGPCFFVRTGNKHSFGMDLQEHCYLTMTRPQEQRI